MAYDDPRAALDNIAALKGRVDQEGARIFARWSPLIERGEFAPSARNLADYLAMRAEDHSQLQASLSRLGLSSFGRAEARVAPSLAAIESALAAIAGARPWGAPSDKVDFDSGDRLITARAAELFGADPAGPRTRIMATLPTSASEDSQLIESLVGAGVDAFRINCAHDESETWRQMVKRVRKAGAAANRRLPILMDLAGPKCRLLDVSALKSRLFVGDRFSLFAGPLPSRSEANIVAAAVSLPKVLPQVREGDEVWIDDGRIGGVVEIAREDVLVCKVTQTRPEGRRLKPGKSVNFPTTTIEIDALTPKDLRDLDFVAEYADVVGYSFVQTANDVQWLQRELETRRAGAPPLGLALKIETRFALQNLPDLMVAAAGRNPTAVMIARGDLGVEIGFETLSEIQEQILWLCHAAHLPVIWATQVAEGVIKNGTPARSEVTDVAMAQRAECVMLNKGSNLVEGARFVDNILRRMDRHQYKKSPRMSALAPWLGAAASAPIPQP